MKEHLKIGAQDFGFDRIIYVNGRNHVENLKPSIETRKVCLIEQDCHWPMLDMESV